MTGDCVVRTGNSQGEKKIQASSTIQDLGRLFSKFPTSTHVFFIWELPLLQQKSTRKIRVVPFERKRKKRQYVYYIEV